MLLIVMVSFLQMKLEYILVTSFVTLKSLMSLQDCRGDATELLWTGEDVSTVVRDHASRINFPNLDEEAVKLTSGADLFNGLPRASVT